MPQILIRRLDECMCLSLALMINEKMITADRNYIMAS